VSRVGVKDKIRWLGFTRYTTRDANKSVHCSTVYTQNHNSAMGSMGRRPSLGPSHPQTHKCTVYGDDVDDTPLYKPRGSARSALLTAVRSRRSGLAVHPRWKGTTMGTTRCGP
jgi:hypothetical protein